MDLRLTLLTGSLLLAALSLPAHAAVPKCLSCHQAHFAGRGTCLTCHGGDERTDRKELAHRSLVLGAVAWFAIADSAPVKRGEKLMADLACRRCHVTGGKGNRLAASLDRLTLAAVPRIEPALRNPAVFMPRFHLTDSQIADLTAALLSGRRETNAKGENVPDTVHFEPSGEGTQNAFKRLCGDCHRALASRYGGMGKGNVGPNLSGLFSPFYPKTAKSSGPWTETELKRWLKNPRQIRPHAVMQPVVVTQQEFGELVKLFKVDSEGGR